MTTLDLDFMFRKTSTNLRKLKAVADDLEAVVMRPFYPVSDCYRVVRDRDSLQLDFMVKTDGIRSFERLRDDVFCERIDSSVHLGGVGVTMRFRKCATVP